MVSRTVAVIGLGHTGGPMAADLVEAGHRVLGHDLVAIALDDAVRNGVEAAPSATGAVAAAEIVITMLPAGRHVLGLYDDILGAARPGTAERSDVAPPRERLRGADASAGSGGAAAPPPSEPRVFRGRRPPPGRAHAASVRVDGETRAGPRPGPRGAVTPFTDPAVTPACRSRRTPSTVWSPGPRIRRPLSWPDRARPCGTRWPTARASTRPSTIRPGLTEQFASNALIRPSAAYDGPRQRPVPGAPTC